MSKRAAVRQKRQQVMRRRQLALGLIVIGLSVAVVAYLIYQQNQPLGEFVTITPVAPAQADGKTMGDPNAPAVIELFEDFQCPACGLFSRTYKSQLIELFVDTGKARLEYHHYTVVDINTGKQESTRAAEASECAAKQNLFWQYHDVLFANQNGEGIGTFADRRLMEMGKMAGLNQSEFERCFRAGEGRAAVNSDMTLAAQRGVSGTPSIFVNGVKIDNFSNMDEFAQIINPLSP